MCLSFTFYLEHVLVISVRTRIKRIHLIFLILNISRLKFTQLKKKILNNP